MTAAITEVDDPVNKTLAIGLFTFIFVSVGLYAVYFFIISRYLRGRWARNNGVQLIKSDRDLGRQTRDVFDLAGWDHCAYDVLIIPTNAGNAKYYEVRWFTRDSQGSLGSSEGRKVQHSKAYFYYPLPGFLPYITIEPERRFGRANDDINTEWQVQQGLRRQVERRTDGARSSSRPRPRVPHGSHARLSLDVYG